MPVTRGTSASSQLHALDILEATGRLSQQLVPIVTLIEAGAGTERWLPS